MFRPSKRLTLGALTAIIIGIVTALAVAAGAFGEDRLTVERDGAQASATQVHPLNSILDAHEAARRYSAQYERLDRFEMRTVADSRHFIMLNQPERFADDLQRAVQGE